MAKRSEEAYNRWVEAKQGDAKQPSTKLSWRHSAVSWISRRWQDQPTVKLAVLAVFVLVAVLAVFVLRQEVNSCSVEAADLKSKEQQLRKDYESKKNDAFDLRKDNESMKKKVAELKDQLKKEKKESAELKSKEQQLREDYESKKNCAFL